MDALESIIKISSGVMEYLSGGLIPDDDTISFIKSAYGIIDPYDIASFIENGDDSGAVIDLLSYPSDSLREYVEELIPLQGLPDEKIKIIETGLCSIPLNIYIFYNNRKICISQDDSLYCTLKMIRRLNLNLQFNWLSIQEDNHNSPDILPVRAFLRKKRFISGYENCLFMNDLLFNYHSQKNNSISELYNLAGFSADVLKCSDRKPLEILSEKKYYYESAIMESEEFARLMKTYSMEFIMMKKIQPPLISTDEARTIIQTIDRLTCIVYGMIIPPVRNIVIES